MGDEKAKKEIEKIENENIVKDIEREMKAAKQGDTEAGGNCQSRLITFRNAIDTVEELLEWPQVVAAAKEQIEDTKNIIELGDAEDKEDFKTLKREINEAIEARDEEQVKMKTNELSSVSLRIRDNYIEFWISLFNLLKEEQTKMAPAATVKQLFAMGQKAVESNDKEGVKSVVLQLLKILPEEEQGKYGVGSTVERR